MLHYAYISGMSTIVALMVDTQHAFHVYRIWQTCMTSKLNARGKAGQLQDLTLQS